MLLYTLLAALRILNSTISRSLQLKLPWASHSHQHLLVDENKVQHFSSKSSLSFGESSYHTTFQEFLLCCPSKRYQGLPWGPGLVDMRPLLSVFRGAHLVGGPVADPHIMSPIPVLPLKLTQKPLAGSLHIPTWTSMHFLW